MVSSCCAYGCSYRYRKEDKISFFRFPKNPQLLALWMKAIRRENWIPTSGSRLCGQHFQSGKPSSDENHPDYVPNVFIFNQNPKTTVKPFERRQRVASKKRQIENDEVIEAASEKGPVKSETDILTMDIANWSIENTVQLVSLYQEYECLWNPHFWNYRNREERKAAESEIVARMGVEGFTFRELRKKMRNVRTEYHKRRKIIKNSSGKSCCPVHIKLPKWFKIMDEIVERRSLKGRRRKELFIEGSSPCPHLEEVVNKQDTQQHKGLINGQDIHQHEDSTNKQDIHQHEDSTNEQDIHQHEDSTNGQNILQHENLINRQDIPVDQTVILIPVNSQESLPTNINRIAFPVQPQERKKRKQFSPKKKFLGKSVKELKSPNKTVLPDEKLNSHENRAFGSFVAASLEKLPVEQALLAQQEIHSALMKYRLKALPSTNGVNNTTSTNQVYHLFFPETLN